eukprot:SAG22_NODE_2230_length_2811_cov_1.654499_4_plen_127_part_01
MVGVGIFNTTSAGATDRHRFVRVYADMFHDGVINTKGLADDSPAVLDINQLEYALSTGTARPLNTMPQMANHRWFKFFEFDDKYKKFLTPFGRHVCGVHTNLIGFRILKVQADEDEDTGVQVQKKPA